LPVHMFVREKRLKLGPTDTHVRHYDGYIISYNWEGKGRYGSSRQRARSNGEKSGHRT